MSEQTVLRIEQPVQVSMDGEKWYNSKIITIKSGIVSITPPSIEGHLLELRRGDQIRVRFFQDDSSYYFTTRITGEASSDGNMYKFAHPGEITRVQQRMHVRVPVMLDVEYAPADADSGGNDEEVAYIKALSVDISGGGMKLAVRQRVQENSLLLLRFTLPFKNKPQPLELKARVIRCVEIDPLRDIYQLGLRFEDIKYRQQDIIVRFVFEKAARHKRLL